MVVCMALMIAINVGVMIYKSLKASRRQSRLNRVRDRKLEAHNQEIEVKAANKPFTLSAGLAEANALWRKNNPKPE